MNPVGDIVRKTVIVIGAEHCDYSHRILHKQKFNIAVAFSIGIDTVGHFAKLPFSDCLGNPVETAILGKAF